MTDVFFSYSSKDRERVRPFKDRLESLGFTVFWDLETPAGQDWNSFIRSNLDRARSVLVFWSANSLNSDPVKTEADQAKREGKLIPVRLDEAIDETRLPLGHDRMQIKYLGDWSGEPSHPVWLGVLGEIERIATPPWLVAKFASIKGELRAEVQRRLHAEGVEKSVEEQLAKSVATESAARKDASEARGKAERLEASYAALLVKLEAAEQRAKSESNKAERLRQVAEEANAARAKAGQSEAALAERLNRAEASASSKDRIVSVLEGRILRMKEELAVVAKGAAQASAPSPEPEKSEPPARQPSYPPQQLGYSTDYAYGSGWPPRQPSAYAPQFDPYQPTQGYPDLGGWPSGSTEQTGSSGGYAQYPADVPDLGGYDKPSSSTEQTGISDDHGASEDYQEEEPGNRYVPRRRSRKPSILDRLLGRKDGK